MRRVRRPCAPASSALPKPMEGALCSGAVTERPAGAAGEKATGDIMASISKGSKSEGRQGRSGINWEGRFILRALNVAFIVRLYQTGRKSSECELTTEHLAARAVLVSKSCVRGLSTQAARRLREHGVRSCRRDLDGWEAAAELQGSP